MQHSGHFSCIRIWPHQIWRKLRYSHEHLMPTTALRRTEKKELLSKIWTFVRNSCRLFIRLLSLNGFTWLVRGFFFFCTLAYNTIKLSGPHIVSWHPVSQPNDVMYSCECVWAVDVATRTSDVFVSALFIYVYIYFLQMFFLSHPPPPFPLLCSAAIVVINLKCVINCFVTSDWKSYAWFHRCLITFRFWHLIVWWRWCNSIPHFRCSFSPLLTLARNAALHLLLLRLVFFSMLL